MHTKRYKDIINTIFTVAEVCKKVQNKRFKWGLNEEWTWFSCVDFSEYYSHWLVCIAYVSMSDEQERGFIIVPSWWHWCSVMCLIYVFLFVFIFSFRKVPAVVSALQWPNYLHFLSQLLRKANTVHWRNHQDLEGHLTLHWMCLWQAPPRLQQHQKGVRYLGSTMPWLPRGRNHW